MPIVRLAKCEFDGWFQFFKNKELSKKDVWFALNLDNVIMMSSKVHGKVNQGPLYNMNVLFKLSSEKVTPKIKAIEPL